MHRPLSMQIKQFVLNKRAILNDPSYTYVFIEKIFYLFSKQMLTCYKIYTSNLKKIVLIKFWLTDYENIPVFLQYMDHIYIKYIDWLIFSSSIHFFFIKLFYNLSWQQHM